MIHKVVINASEFAQGLKDCSLYANKNSCHDVTGYILLAMLPKAKKLSMLACDGKGLYERKITPVNNSKKACASLPGNRHLLMLSYNELAALIKFVSTYTFGAVTLDVDDNRTPDNNLIVRVTLANGSSTIFLSDENIEPIDYTCILQQADRARKSKSCQNNLLIPANELIRLAKVLPKRGSYSEVQMFTYKAQNGLLTLVEYQNGEDQIRIVFISRLESAESKAA